MSQQRPMSFFPMDEIVPNLLLGSVPKLGQLQRNVHQIHSILSIMKGIVCVPKTFVHMQIPIDDSDEEDILAHFPRSIAFIQGELDHGRRVLVHCQAGISRSPTIVAAYLMYSRSLDRDAALNLIEQARPFISPNDGFMEQLEIFHRGGCRVSREDDATHLFYKRRAARDFLWGERTPPNVTTNFTSYSNSKLDLVIPPAIPPSLLGKPHQRILCRMCRRELATREHISDHGQSNSPSPSLDSLSTKSQSFQGEDHATETPSQRSDLESLPSPDVQGTPDKCTATSDQVQPTVSPESSPGLNPSVDPSRSNPSTENNGTISIETTHRSLPINLPIIPNPMCSGYFLEQMDWMELEEGQVTGKIMCPNKKCGAKLGNYDWSGVCCGCGEWVTPGFCISRSKVDEVV